MVSNVNHVPLRQWRRWSDQQRAIFNGVHADLTHMGQSCFLHPETVGRQLSTAEYDTICWNAAWIAADQAGSPGLISEIETVNIAA